MAVTKEAVVCVFSEEAVGPFALLKACFALSLIFTEQGSGKGSSPMKVKEGIVTSSRRCVRERYQCVLVRNTVDAMCFMSDAFNNFSSDALNRLRSSCFFCDVRPKCD